MKIKRISIYNEFECIGAACSVNCCRGWKIPVDKEARQKFLEKKGLLGTILRCSIVRKKDITYFRSVLGRCPFWGLDRLCMLQKKHGMAYLPFICIQFPRQLFHLGFFCEETLYLACPEAARLFLISVQQKKAFDFVETDGSVSYAVNTTNDDKCFLDYLLQARKTLIDMLHSGCRYNSRAILNYGYAAQNAAFCNLPFPNPIDFQENIKECCVMGLDIMDTLFFHNFYQPNLQTVSPMLYKLCQCYLKEFGMPGRKNTANAERRLSALQEHLYTLVPDLDILLNRYYEYYLLTNFLNVFEDYSFVKHLLFGIAKVNMLWLLFALYAKRKKKLSIEEMAEIIAVYERRAPQIKEALQYLSI